MARKSITKDMNGNIINLIDETDGGYIVRNRQVVNHDKWNKLVQIEQDRREAAKAALEAIAVSAELAELRNKTGVTPEQVEQAKKGQHVEVKTDIEKRVDGLEDKLDQILKALQK